MKGAKQTVKVDNSVMLIDFWATWCPPCQKPMAHNCEMMTNNPNWKGKVRIIGLSCDEELDTVKQRIDEKKWDNIE